MIKTIGIILFLFCSWGSSSSGGYSPVQSEGLISGIYILTTPPKKVACANEARMIVTGQKICISKKPIIAADELTYATDIEYDPKYELHYIDIGLSTSGGSTLTQTVQSLPDSRFALALEGQVICVFSADPSIAIRSFRIGADINLKDLTTIHDVLKNVKFN
jgi:hypothetical protein